MVEKRTNLNNKNTTKKNNIRNDSTRVSSLSRSNKNYSSVNKKVKNSNISTSNNFSKSAPANNTINKNFKNNNQTQNNVSSYKKVIKKKKIKFKNIIILILIVSILSLIPIYFFVLKSRNSDVDTDNNYDSNNTIDNDKVEIVKDEWEIMQEKLDFYNPDFKERYISYHNNNPTLDLETVIVYVNIGLDNDFYTNISDSPRQEDSLVLANKYYSLSSNFVPDDLETINSKYSSGSKKLKHDARVAFEQMAKDAKLDGYTIRAVSTYRSYSYQKQLYSNYVKNDGVKNADTYSARAGHSEHQTGLAVDVDNSKVSYTSFGNTKEFKWMLENAHKYGFILRYTKDNEFITGYKDEPWHYRYVGVDIATYIYENPMTYEEYYVRFLSN